MMTLGNVAWSVAALAVLGCQGAASVARAPEPPPKDAPPVCPLGGCRTVEQRRPAAAEVPCATDAACTAEVTAACDDKRAGACVTAGLGLWSAEHARLSRVFMLFDRACSLGAADGCHYAGGMLLEGSGTTKDAARGTSLLDRACDAGIGRACGILAQRAPRGDSAGAMQPGTRDYYAALHDCREGAGASCFTVALHFDKGDSGYPQDVARSGALYDAGCKSGSWPACNNLGYRFSIGQGVPLDLARAAELFERACRGADMAACANLGLAAEHGLGVTRDLARAESLYTLACSFGRPYACVHARMLEDYERGTPRDLPKARAIWSERCEKQNDGKACSYLGLLAQDGLGGEARDEQRALTLMQRACRLSEPESCRWLRDHARTAGLTVPVK